MTPSTQLLMTKDSVLSSDGTRIGFLKFGVASPLVVVHGSLGSSESWLQVAHLLAPNFTCYVLDRRGRGMSGDSADHSLQHEYEDVAAVLEYAGNQASLLGHSYGALCALGASLLRGPKRLVLYEPPLPITGPIAGDGLLQYRSAIEQGRPEKALEIGMIQFAGTTPEQFEALKNSSIWPRLITLAPSWVREIQAIDGLDRDPEKYRPLTMPTLLLMGSETKEHPTYRAGAAALSRVLPGFQLRQLNGQGHMAHINAPEMVADIVREFLLS